MIWTLKGICKGLNRIRYFSIDNFKPPWKILFFGNDNFSMFSLKLLTKHYKSGHFIKHLGVVSSLKSRKNVVKEYAMQNQLEYYEWPLTCLREDAFDLGVVVSFGNLIPEHVINKFPLGILNVHASLLPRWRGAAPIIHAIANGDKVTGITIMQIKPHRFDIGDILMQRKVKINRDSTAIDLHFKLGQLGAAMLINVIEDIHHYFKLAKPQSDNGVTYAPKVTASMSYIDWEKMSSEQICNLARALVGTQELVATWRNRLVKLIDITECEDPPNESANIEVGGIYFNKNTKKLLVKCKDQNWISIGKVKIYGNKIMSANDFNNGYVKKEPSNLRRFLSVNK